MSASHSQRSLSNMILPFRSRINTNYPRPKRTRLTRVGQLRALGFAVRDPEAKAVNIEIEEAVLANDWPGAIDQPELTAQENQSSVRSTAMSANPLSWTRECAEALADFWGCLVVFTGAGNLRAGPSLPNKESKHS
jgi:hypothetical protein